MVFDFLKGVLEMWENLINYIKVNPFLFVTSTLVATIFGTFLKFLFDFIIQRRAFNYEYNKRLSEDFLKTINKFDIYLNKFCINYFDNEIKKDLLFIIMDDEKAREYEIAMQDLNHYEVYLNKNIRNKITKIHNLYLERYKIADNEKANYSIKIFGEFTRLLNELYEEKNILLYRTNKIKKLLKKNIDLNYEYSKYRVLIRLFFLSSLYLKKLLNFIIYKDIEKEDKENKS
jgi:hypothetical protein